MEDTRRRNEASMARKRANAKAINPAAANSGVGDGPLSPSSTGAMDSLLEKLRAAAPEARNQRDRRRRARLKDRHQVRVASGQTIPDIGDLTRGSEDEDGEADDGTLKAGKAADDRMEPISEGEDVAHRAASMLQGLRGDDGDGSKSRDSGSLRIRRRRESADDERRNRRRRRAKEGNTGETDADGSRPGTSDGVKSPTLPSNAIPEEGDDEDADEGEETILADDSHNAVIDDDDDEGVDTATKSSKPQPPRTVISPPTPEPGSRTETLGSSD